jgi:hypothetical protein
LRPLSRSTIRNRGPSAASRYPEMTRRLHSTEGQQSSRPGAIHILEPHTLAATTERSASPRLFMSDCTMNRERMMPAGCSQHSFPLVDRAAAGVADSRFFKTRSGVPGRHHD